MTEPAIIPGTVLEWDRFMDSKGNEVPKLFVIVGAHPDRNYLSIKSTSKKRWRTYQPSDDADYYYLPGQRREWFDVDGSSTIVGWHWQGHC